MPNSIRDGKGNGYLVGITSEHRMRVSSVSRSKEHNANLEKGNAYNVLISQTPTGAGDCFLYMKNTGINNIIIEGFAAYVASNEIFHGYLGQTGTPVGGTDALVPNLNAGSANTPIGTFLVGNDITGLSGGRLMQRARVPANNATNGVNFEADIILPPQTTFVSYAMNGGALVEGHMTFWIEEEEI